MRRYPGNATVDPGIYFNRRELRFKSMAEEGRLPGGPDATWMRVPALTLLVAGPLLGAVYAIFLPFIGFALLLGALGAKLKEAAGRAAGAAARVRRPAWQPAEASLARRQPAAAPPPATEVAGDEWVAEVKDELERRGAGQPPAG
jgi:hypothetical protein